MDQELDYKTIGENIRYYRQRAGLKQNRLSELIDVSPQHISHIENGAKLSLPLLVKIATALNVGADCLLGSNLPKSKETASQNALLMRNADQKFFCRRL